jgi:hypothetical protein
MTNTNIENEQFVRAIDFDNKKNQKTIQPESVEKKYNGLTLEQYLQDLEQQFSINAEISDEELIDIKHNLKMIEESERSGVKIESHEASQAILNVFKNMEIWQKNMLSMAQASPEDQKNSAHRYYGSKKVFMTSCHTLFPGTNIMKSSAGREMMTFGRELAVMVHPEAPILPNLEQKLSQLPDFDLMANQLHGNIDNNPVDEVKRLEMIMYSISEGVQKDMKIDLTPEAKKQIKICIEILYKIQMLIDRIKDSGAYKKQAESIKLKAKSEKPENEVKEQDIILTPEEIAADKFVERPIF